MRSVGLDIATNLGLALVEGNECKGKSLSFPKQKGFARLQLIASEVERILLVWQPELVMVEGYGFGNRFTLVTLAEVGTVVRVVLNNLKLPWLEVAPTTLKKWATGNGAAKKDQMAAAAKKQFNFESPYHDVIDAFWLAKMGQVDMIELLKIKGVYK